jgi:hypothetical protein
MASLLIALNIVEAILLLAFLILAVVAYRITRSTGFLLLMVASIFYLLPRLAPFAIALFFQKRGRNASGIIDGWIHSWGYFWVHAFDVLFLGLIIVAIVFFIRERKVVIPHA